MDNKTRHPNHDRDPAAAHGCCGGAHKQAAKEEKKETGCGCGDKHAKPASAATTSCCG